jgi:dipeptidyl aminopeptidase/acylaminoacyl peptidase
MWWLGWMAWGAETWRQPNDEVLAAMRAPETPTVSLAPDGGRWLEATPVRYPPIADRARPMWRLAGQRIDVASRAIWGAPVAADPRIRDLGADGDASVPVQLPAGAALLGATWRQDGDAFALRARVGDEVQLWLAAADGSARRVPGVSVPGAFGGGVSWMPDGRHLLVVGAPATPIPAPAPATTPPGPFVAETQGAGASSTYEARDLLTSAWDEAAFVAVATQQIYLVDATDLSVVPVGAPDTFAAVSASPSGERLLVERMVPPWSWRTTWENFAREVEVWGLDGAVQLRVASVPAAEQVPIHGVRTGARDIGWRPTGPDTVVWVAALDGGDPKAKVTHRDEVVAQAVTGGAPRTLYRAPHRVMGRAWGERGLMVVAERAWETRWRYATLVSVDRSQPARPWFDLSENDRYADPGSWLQRQLPNGKWVLEQDGDAVWFAGMGASPQGDRPFLDKRSLTSGAVTRVFRSAPDAYETFAGFLGRDRGALLVRREQTDSPPNYVRATLGAAVAGAPGEATRARTDQPLTRWADPQPQLRGVSRKIVSYTRRDGVPLSFQLLLPPGYTGGALPTVLYAYPREYSDPATAGQVTGSPNTFLRVSGASHLYFLLRGYAVLDATAMPVVGDPETAYDTFVSQLTWDAEAAIDQAVSLGVTDRSRVGIMGHSHGALMTATLLARSDLFRAGIARSGAYNHTIRPFGYQSERRTLWEAEPSYLDMTVTRFVPTLREPILIMHGQIDENPGTIPFQSDRLYDAVRGSGGTARLVMLPYEGHGYLARESVEQVVAEQLDWFDRWVKPAGVPGQGPSGGPSASPPAR